MKRCTFVLFFGLLILAAVICRAADASLTLARENNFLVIRGAQIPGGEIRINYLEAYCRAGSSDADWVKHTVIKHTSELVSLSDDGRVLKQRDMLADGVTRWSTRSRPVPMKWTFGSWRTIPLPLRAKCIGRSRACD